MKTEFATPKDLEKLRVEMASKAGGGKIDPTHPDMGPIMDSLIMTSKDWETPQYISELTMVLSDDRPYIDCATTTPMTGTGLVKFERFTAINKLPWDDVNDQFVIQVRTLTSFNRLRLSWCAGARGVRCLRDGHPAGRHAQCEDCQQHVGEGGEGRLTVQSGHSALTALL